MAPRGYGRLSQPTQALVAAVAIRLDVPVLHLDRDYGRIAEHTTLRLVAT